MNVSFNNTKICMSNQGLDFTSDVKQNLSRSYHTRALSDASLQKYYINQEYKNGQNNKELLIHLANKNYNKKGYAFNKMNGMNGKKVSTTKMSYLMTDLLDDPTGATNEKKTSEEISLPNTNPKGNQSNLNSRCNSVNTSVDKKAPGNKGVLPLPINGVFDKTNVSTNYKEKKDSKEIFQGFASIMKSDMQSNENSEKKSKLIIGDKLDQLKNQTSSNYIRAKIDKSINFVNKFKDIAYNNKTLHGTFKFIYESQLNKNPSHVLNKKYSDLSCILRNDVNLTEYFDVEEMGNYMQKRFNSVESKESFCTRMVDMEKQRAKQKRKNVYPNKSLTIHDINRIDDKKGDKPYKIEEFLDGFEMEKEIKDYNTEKPKFHYSTAFNHKKYEKVWGINDRRIIPLKHRKIIDIKSANSPENKPFFKALHSVLTKKREIEDNHNVFQTSFFKNASY